MNKLDYHNVRGSTGPRPAPDVVAESDGMKALQHIIDNPQDAVYVLQKCARRAADELEALRESDAKKLLAFRKLRIERDELTAEVERLKADNAADADRG